MSLTISIGSVA